MWDALRLRSVFYAGRFRFGGDLIKKLDFKSIVTFAVVGTLVIGVLVIIAGIPIGYIDAETAKSVIMSLSENFDRILMMIIMNTTPRNNHNIRILSYIEIIIYNIRKPTFCYYNWNMYKFIFSIFFYKNIYSLFIFFCYYIYVFCNFSFYTLSIFSNIICSLCKFFFICYLF